LRFSVVTPAPVGTGWRVRRLGWVDNDAVVGDVQSTGGVDVGRQRGRRCVKESRPIWR